MAIGFRSVPVQIELILIIHKTVTVPIRCPREQWVWNIRNVWTIVADVASPIAVSVFLVGVEGIRAVVTWVAPTIIVAIYGFLCCVPEISKRAFIICWRYPSDYPKRITLVLPFNKTITIKVHWNWFFLTFAPRR